MWDALRLDVRHSFRSLRRAPTFSLIVIVTLTLAVGATAAVGSLLNALVLRTLKVPSPGQLVVLSAFEPRANVEGYFYADTVNAYRASQRSFSQMSMYAGGGILRVEMTGARSGVFEDAVTEAVSPRYFDMVGARASAGLFNESDDAVVVITEAYRRRIFGDASGIGEVIKVNAVPATVIGVAADGFDGLQSDGGVDIFVPFAVMRTAGGAPSALLRSKQVVGRLAPGVSIEAARAELLARWPSVQAATLPALPEADRQALLSQRLIVAPLASGFSGLRDRYGTTLWVLLALMGILLAVACANLAGLTLARSLTRRHQVAIRLALGGSARRVFWQLLVDGILLSAVAFSTYFGLKVPVPTDYHYTRADGVTPLDATVLTDFVSPGFFDLFRFHLLKGRDVSWNDGLGKPAVALISASLARALFPAGNELGQHIRIAGPDRRDVELIGVVDDAPYVKLDDPHPLVVFRPIMQETARMQFPMAYVRATGDLATVRDGYTRVIKSLGHRSLRAFITSSEWVDGALLQERFTAGLATFAAALTVLLACMGVYGLLAYSITARVREIGVRVALGATRATIVWMIVRDGLAIAVPGVLVGAPCAWAAARLVRAQLYGITPGDPRTLVLGATIILFTVLAASLVPALRASKVAPLEALREE